MCLALSSIVLSTAIGCNVLALWLTGGFESRRPVQTPLAPSGTLQANRKRLGINIARAPALRVVFWPARDKQEREARHSCRAS